MMVCRWYPDGMPSAFLWYVNGMLMVCQWYFNGILMVCQRNTINTIGSENVPYSISVTGLLWYVTLNPLRYHNPLKSIVHFCAVTTKRGLIVVCE